MPPGDVLILGGGGLLGSSFASALGEAGEVWGRGALTLADPAALARNIETHPAQTVINCAAHTDVEGAEADPTAAYAVNAVLPQVLASACFKSGKRLIHISSTGCYGRWKSTPYTDFDRTEPPTVHHKSKIAGEDAVRSLSPAHLIVRTGWLFGGDPANPKNFVWRRLLEARGAARLMSDPYQVGCPTYVEDVVRQVLNMAAADLRGTFNVVSRGSASRLDYVSKIIEASGLDCVVEATTTPFARKAAVSNNEAALNLALDMLQMNKMPRWEDALVCYTKQLLVSSVWKSLAV